MVAFSLVESASRWVQTCGFQFPLLVDTDRTLFTELGLGRSVVAVWNMQALTRYAEKVATGDKLLRSLEGDDVHQLGGDCVVDSTGKLVYVYRGRNSYDRPTIPQLLKELEQLQRGYSDIV